LGRFGGQGKLEVQGEYVRGRGSLTATLAIAGTAVLAAQAHAGEVLNTAVSAATANDRSCARLETGAAGSAQRTVAGPALGSVTARLDGASGDWDLAIFEAGTGRLVAGSAYSGAHEVASGFVTGGRELVVQACRRTGSASQARLTVDTRTVTAGTVAPASLVRVSTPTRERKQQLVNLGLDVTEHGGPGYISVVLHGAKDALELTQNGFQYTTSIADLTARSRADRRKDAAFAAANVTSELPSGRTTYRRLFDYGEDLKRLAREHPDLVRPITLNHQTYEGRPVEGIEITTTPNARDGKPVFLQMGAHHAREWPSAEHAMEWAYDLILGYRRGDARTKRLVESTRTIVVPVINPDGFNASREAGELFGASNGRGGTADDETVNILTHPNEYRRKNCRMITGDESGSCLQPAFGLASAGVDPNRNYGGFWGGPGASGDPTNETYYGTGPFSEPETKNVHELIASRQVTTLITNHTFSNLVLRPPGIQVQGPAPDEPIYKALGDAMAAENGYTSQLSYQLYDTTGTTEDWSYYATGGLGFTFEIGPEHFHPPFEEAVAEYEGTTAIAAGGNREAYFKAQENTADTTKHSVLAGQAPAGAVLRLRKTFETPTSQNTTFTDTLDSTTVVPAGGRFEWHVNQSTRPLVAQERGRPATGEPSPPQQFAARGESTPCANFDDPPPSCYEDHVITVPAGEGIDNARATIRIEWPTPVSDYDMKVLKDGVEVGSSGQGTTNFEQVTLGDPAPGEYVVRVINFAGVEPWSGTVSFEGPEEFQPAESETWTLFCEQPEGRIHSARQVAIARGERRALDLRRACTPQR
jgi:hypothetical protein